MSFERAPDKNWPWQTSEQDTASEASDLEALAKARMMQDKQLRAMAPPMDWEAIASEGAARLAVQWNNTQGTLHY